MNSIHCFAIKRGEIRERFDPHFHHPFFKELVTKITSKNHLCLSEIITQSAETWDLNSSLYLDCFPYIEISAIGLGTNDYFTTTTPIQEAPSRARQVVRTDDILVSLTRPHRGAIAKIKQADNLAIASTGFAVLREIKLKDFDRDFLLNVLLSSICLPQLLQRSSGGNYPAITSDQLDKILIPKVDLEMQLRLVADLENARIQRLAKISKAEELLKGLDEYILAKLDIIKPTEERIKIFSRKRYETLNSRIDPHFHSPYYKKVLKAVKDSKFNKHPLSSLLVDIAGGATPKKGDADLYDSFGIKFLRILNVKPYYIDLNDVKYIQPHVHNAELLRSQLIKDDVVMTITGRVGTAATIEEEILPANINQHLVRLRIKDQACLSKYLSAYLNTSVGNAMTNKGVSGGTRIAVDYKWVGSLPIPIPPMEIQQEIIDEITQRKNEYDKLVNEAETEWQNAKIWFEEQLLNKAK